MFTLAKVDDAWPWPNQKENFEKEFARDTWAVKGGTEALGCFDRLGDIVIDVAGGKGNSTDFGGGHEAFEGAQDDEEDLE